MILQRCLICRKFNSRPYLYPYSQNLPNIKVNDKIAFYGIGVDYLRSLYCKGINDINSLEGDYGLFKCYVVLYTCASTRGVILELVLESSSKNFVQFQKIYCLQRLSWRVRTITGQLSPLRKLKICFKPKHQLEIQFN